MIDTGYALDEAHRVRYFFSEPDLAKLLKQMRRFVKDNSHLEIDSVNIDSHYCYEQEAQVWEARVIYLGVAN